jgi:hypothetical protein
MRTLRLFYLGIDLRSLAVLRIGLGLLLLFDLAKRVSGVGLWYVNSGLLPNHRMLWHPSTPYHFSYLFSLWTNLQMRIAFAAIAIIYLCFLVGYRTRLFHILRWLTLLRIHTRTTLITNGGDCVFCAMLLWTMFMPLGRRYSVDALRLSAKPEPTDPEQFVSLSVVALRLQLCVIYLLNALNKTGDTWKDGSAVHYLLYQARIVTTLGIWVREHAPTSILRSLTYGTLVIEYAIPLLILLPWGKPWPRRLAILLMWGLHSNIALLSNLGMFSVVMIVYSLCLLDSSDLDRLAALPKLRNLVEAVAARASQWRERHRITATTSATTSQLTPFGERIQRGCRLLRETVVGVLIACAISQLVHENDAVFGTLHREQPLIVHAIVDYLQLNQGWSMFAPDAPRTDEWVVVDAVTESGRHIDPYNLRASMIADPKLRTIPSRLDQNVYFCDYTLRIPDEEEFHEAFHDWILDHGRRAHAPDEKIVRFDAYIIENDSPPLGQSQPTGTKSHVFLSGSRDE